ncbi:MAG: hypothetical protein Ct9H300mP5_2570 [Candidatus Pelagibacterales bacterium]|nr:MAG: hypothetical protein Ct9H300mP5_2570 [Pelagibacterales bacterium]
MMKDRLLRPSLVGVTKKREQKDKKTQKLMKKKVRKIMRKNDLLTCSRQKNTHIATKGN